MHTCPPAVTLPYLQSACAAMLRGGLLYYTRGYAERGAGHICFRRECLISSASRPRVPVLYSMAPTRGVAVCTGKPCMTAIRMAHSGLLLLHQPT